MRHDIGSILQLEFSKRKKTNVKYSLRAFSRDLKLSPSFLSEVLQNKKKVSIDRALQISRFLGWTWRESQIFLQTAQLGHAKSRGARQFLKREINKSEEIYGKFQNLKLNKFSPLSNWYCLAILELAELPDFSGDGHWIARRLGIEVKEAETAFQQLKSAGLLAQESTGKWQKKINSSVADIRADDIRKFHRQHLVNAAKAIEEQDFERRHASGLTMAIDPAKLPQAQELIKEFRSRMSALLESGTKKSVYHLAIQLFQLDTGVFRE